MMNIYVIKFIFAIKLVGRRGHFVGHVAEESNPDYECIYD